MDKISKTPLLEFYDVYIDVVSGKSMKTRKKLNRLLADCEAGYINEIYVKSISRLSRNTVDVINLSRKLRDIGINIHFDTENIDTIKSDSELSLSQ